MANSTTAAGGTVLSIPPGTNWIGSVHLSATLMSLIGAAAVTAFPSVTLSGTGGNMNDGDTIVSVALSLPAINVTALAGAQTTATAICGPMNIQTRGNAVKLILNYGAGVTAVAVACGEMR